MPKKKGKKLEQNQVDQHMEAYAAANAEPLLEDAFGKWDNIYNPRTQFPYLDRADHIIIGGRTATELLLEKFEPEFPNVVDSMGKHYADYQRDAAYETFYRQKGKQYVNQMVSEALARGETVEVFVPDKETGRIKDTPMKLTSSGYEPTGPLAKPAQLNRWQRFWNRFGFYKKEKAAVVNYEKEMAARNKVQFCNKAAQTCLTNNEALQYSYRKEIAKYHPELLEDMQKNFPHAGGELPRLGETNGFKTSRSSFYANAILVLATKRDVNGKLLYTNEQLFDMQDPKMQKARADAIKEVYDHYKPGALLKQEQAKKAEAERKGEKYEIDPKLQAEADKAQDWLVDVQRDAANVLPDRLSDQASKLDFSKPDLTAQKGYREFALLSDTAFDQSQDMNASKERMDQRHGKGAYWDASAKVGACSQPYRMFYNSLNAQRYLINGIPGKNETVIMSKLSEVFRAQTLQQQIGKTLAENPGMKYKDAFDDNLLIKANNAWEQAQYEDDMMASHKRNGTELNPVMEHSLGLAQEQIRNPEQFNRQIQSGVLEGRIKLQEVGDFGEDTEGRTIPARFEIRDAKTVEREMQQEQQKQQQKTDDAPVL